jgi:hypothetical protein
VLYSVAFDVWAVESASQKSCLTRTRHKFCKKNSQASQQRPKLWEKNGFLKFWKIAHQNQRNGAKKDSLKNKHGLMLVGKKKHQKTARDIN